MSVQPVALTGVYKNMSRGIIVLVFRCRAIGGATTANSEVSDFCWASRNDIQSMVSEAFVIRVLDAYAEAATPAIRDHDGTRLL